MILKIRLKTILNCGILNLDILSLTNEGKIYSLRKFKCETISNKLCQFPASQTLAQNQLLYVMRSISLQRRISLLNCLRSNKIEFMKSMHRHHQCGGVQQFMLFYARQPRTAKWLGKFFGKLNLKIWGDFLCAKFVLAIWLTHFWNLLNPRYYLPRITWENLFDLYCEITT